MNEAISTVPAGRDKAVDDARLLVTMSEDLNAPSPDHNLLVAFRFGSGRVQDAREDVVVPGPELIAGEDRYECWWYRGEISRSRHGDIRVAECDDYAFVVLQRDDVGFESFREHTYKAYRDLFQAVAGTRHKHLARIWNYFPDINVGDGDHEKYRQFSMYLP